MIKVLHFSDLHIHENYDQNKVLERFIQDIQNKNFDLVILLITLLSVSPVIIKVIKKKLAKE